MGPGIDGLKCRMAASNLLPVAGQMLSETIWSKREVKIGSSCTADKVMKISGRKRRSGNTSVKIRAYWAQVVGAMAWCCKDDRHELSHGYRSNTFCIFSCRRRAASRDSKFVVGRVGAVVLVTGGAIGVVVLALFATGGVVR